MNTVDENSHFVTALQEAQEAGQAVVLATVVSARGSVPRHAGSKMIVYAGGRTMGTIGGGEMESRVIEEAEEAMRNGQPRLLPYTLVDPARGDPGLCGGEVEIFIEPYLPPATVMVVGCGHVGKAVGHMAGWLGFRVALYDDREEMVNPEEIPGADFYLSGSIEEAISKIGVTGNTFVVAVTRNVTIDRQILPRLLETPAPYIGVIGSRRRWEETKRLLREDGLSDGQLARFRSPIGLELNAETPEEIAVSILAEIIMLRRGGDGTPMVAPVAEKQLAQ